MKDSKLIDSSVWIAYLFNGKHSDIIESNEINLLSCLSLFEIKKKLIRNKIENSKIQKSMEFIKKRSLIVPISEEITEKAVDISMENRLPIIDSIIYSTAVTHDAVLVTLDNDFRGLKDVIIL